MFKSTSTTTQDLTDIYRRKTTLATSILLGHHNDVFQAFPEEIRIRNNMLSDPFTRHSLSEALYKRGTAFRPQYTPLGEALSSPGLICALNGVDSRRYITDSYE